MSSAGPIRRIVTGHDAAGKSIVWKDDRREPELLTVEGAGADGQPLEPWTGKFAHVWKTDRSPWDNTDERDLAVSSMGPKSKLSDTNGTVLRIVDFLPGTNCPFHRTLSIDYGIVHEGELFLVLDGGKEVHLKRGDVCVQRGTIHGWRTPPGIGARVYFILIGAESLVLNGEKTGDEGFEPEE